MDEDSNNPGQKFKLRYQGNKPLATLKPGFHMIVTDGVTDRDDSGQKLYSKGRRSVPYKYEDYFEIDFRDWIIIQTFIYCLLTFYSNIASIGGSVVD